MRDRFWKGAVCLLRILLCDDDPVFLALEQETAKWVIQREQLPALVAAAVSSVAEAEAYLLKNPGRYLVFLDFDFGAGRLSGLDFAAALKRQGRRVQVVYTTNHQEKALEILKSGTEPFGFLEKGMNMGTLAAGLRRYIRMALREAGTGKAAEQETILLNLGMGETAKICRSDILYVEAEKLVSHGITYHTVNGSRLTILGTLGEEQKRLGDAFLRVHRSYLAAKSQIVALRGGYLILSGRQEIPCSVKMRNEVKRWAAGT